MPPLTDEVLLEKFRAMLAHDRQLPLDQRARLEGVSDRATAMFVAGYFCREVLLRCEETLATERVMRVVLSELARRRRKARP